MADDEQRIALGRFGRAHGVRGEIRLWPHNARSPLLVEGRTILVGPSPEKARPMRLARVRRDGKGVVVTLEGVAGREAAEALNGSNWYEPRSAFPAAKSDEVYVVDLIGFEVVTVDGRRLGRVDDVMSAGAADVLVIRDGTHQHLVPNVEEFVPRIDLEAGRVLIQPVEGLLNDAD